MMSRVLVTPLDWGLGHATRCIPVVHHLLHRNCTVIIAGSGASLELLKAEFPSLTFLTLTGYDPRYPSKGSMVVKMAQQLPKFLRAIRREHSEIERIVKAYHIDAVISDNRYGCWSKLVPSALITHQSNILMPKRFGWLSSLVKKANRACMKNFAVCWIPDFSDGSLSGSLLGFGKLIHGIPFEFIGALSRFNPQVNGAPKYDALIVLSGPEPQRSLFEHMIREQLKNTAINYFLVRGVPGASNKRSEREADFLTSTELEQYISGCDVVIARSGYSTIMDLAAMGKRAIFVPTPGQTEQEYLADRLKKMRIAYSVPQHQFDLPLALREVRNYTGFVIRKSDTRLLSEAIDKLLPRHERFF